MKKFFGNRGLTIIPLALIAAALLTITATTAAVANSWVGLEKCKKIIQNDKLCNEAEKAHKEGKNAELVIMEGLSAKGQGEGDIRAALAEKKRWAGYLRITKLSWHRGGFGSVMVADLTIKNTASVALKDIEISCDEEAKSGTIVGHNNQNIYEVFNPGETRTVRDLNLGLVHSQANSAECVVSGATAAK